MSKDVGKVFNLANPAFGKKLMDADVYDPSRRETDIFDYIDKKIAEIQDFYDDLGENRSIFHSLMDSAGDVILDSADNPVKTRFVVAIL